MSTSKTVREAKVWAIVEAVRQGADASEIYRLSSLNGWDVATVEQGLAVACKGEYCPGCSAPLCGGGASRF